MPSDTSPGQALSSTTADKRRSSKIGGCVGVLLQIFHGKRLFPRKSLPAERPKQDSFVHPDDKLPVAKLLLIADENNNCGSPKGIPEVFQEGGMPKDEPCEGKPFCGRTPSVVARLMGLETMPPLKPAFDDGKFVDAYKDVSCGACANEQQERDNILSKSWKSIPVSVDRTKESRRGLAEKFVTRRKVPKCSDGEVKGELVKKKVLSKSYSLSGLSPHQLDSTYLTVISASKENPVNMQAKTTRILSTRVNGPVSIGAKDKNLTSEAHWSRKDGGRTQQTSKAMVIKRRITSMTPSEGDRPHGFVNSQRLHDGTIKGSQREPGPSKRGKESYQQGVMRPRAHGSGKVMMGRRQQAETSRRLRQPALTLKSIKTQGSRVSGSSRSAPISSEASNSAHSSSLNKSGSSQPISSRASRNSRPMKELPSLHAEGVSLLAEEGCDAAHAMPSDVSLYDNRLVLSREKDPSIFQDPSIRDLMQGCSTTSEGDTSSSSSTIHTEIFQRSSMESSLSSDQSLSDVNISSGDGLSFLWSGERIPESWETGTPPPSVECERASGIDIHSMEESRRSHLDSANGDSRDAASSSSSSYPYTDADVAREKQVLSYSGKNTAAILQELLMALRSSKSHKTSVDKINDSSRAEDDMEPLLLQPSSKQAGKSVVLFQEDIIGDSCMDVGDQQTTLSSTELSCQDPPSYNSSHYVGTSQGKEGNSCLQCMDCSSISDTQIEDESATTTSNIGGTPTLSVERAGIPDFEALMNTISKLHHIDPEIIGLNVRAPLYHEEKVLKGNDGDMSNESTCSREEYHDLDVAVPSYSTSLSVEDDADIESGLKLAAQNKKLLSDCINESLKSLGKGSNTCSSISGPSLAASHLLCRVYAQIDEWKGMSISMNLDHMVEKEMDNVAKWWQDIAVEKEEVMKVVESTIFGGLLEEVLLELI